MKKLTLSLLTLAAISGLAQAVTVQAPTDLTDGNGLDGNKYYSWGVSIALSAGQTVNSATITYTNIKLTASGSNDRIWTDILNTNTTNFSTTTPVTNTDNDAAGDGWALLYSGPNYTNLGVQIFTLNQSFATLAYTLNSTQLGSLNSYLAGSNHSFSVGLDPDCHYSLGGLKFDYTVVSTPQGNVPDGGSTAFLMVLGLAGLEAFRRKSAARKVS